MNRFARVFLTPLLLIFLLVWPHGCSGDETTETPSPVDTPAEGWYMVCDEALGLEACDGVVCGVYPPSGGGERYDYDPAFFFWGVGAEAFPCDPGEACVAAYEDAAEACESSEGSAGDWSLACEDEPTLSTCDGSLCRVSPPSGGVAALTFYGAEGSAYFCDGVDCTSALASAQAACQ